MNSVQVVRYIKYTFIIRFNLIDKLFLWFMFDIFRNKWNLIEMYFKKLQLSFFLKYWNRFFLPLFSISLWHTVNFSDRDVRATPRTVSVSTHRAGDTLSRCSRQWSRCCSSSCCSLPWGRRTARACTWCRACPCSRGAACRSRTGCSQQPPHSCRCTCCSPLLSGWTAILPSPPRAHSHRCRESSPPWCNARGVH